MNVFIIKSQTGQTIEMNTRYMWKYATIHGNPKVIILTQNCHNLTRMFTPDVYATPTYAVNGLFVLGLETFAQWQQVLDPLLN